MTESKKAPSPKPLEIKRRPDEDASTATARVAINPAVQAAQTAKSYVSGFGDLELVDLLAELQAQTDAANKGDMGRAEAMLAAQAHSLDAIFNALARRAADNLGHYPGTVALYLKLALRAQSQSRATWESLSAIKHPPVANFVGQANITSGPQQVNNGGGRARENENAQNKQSGAADELLPHTRAPSLTGEDNSPLEAVGKIDRAKVVTR